MKKRTPKTSTEPLCSWDMWFPKLPNSMVMKAFNLKKEIVYQGEWHNIYDEWHNIKSWKEINVGLDFSENFGFRLGFYNGYNILTKGKEEDNMVSRGQGMAALLELTKIIEKLKKLMKPIHYEMDEKNGFTGIVIDIKGVGDESIIRKILPKIGFSCIKGYPNTYRIIQP